MSKSAKIKLDLLRQACYINGEWLNDSSKGEIEVYNPFDGSLVGRVPDLPAEQVHQAVAYAEQAQKSWQALTAQQRGDYLQKWADLIDKNKEQLATIMTLEQGKAIIESRQEIDYANSFIRWFAEEGKRIYGDTIPTLNKDLRYTVLKQPIGVCAAITPWNFPAAMITRKVAPALAAGCTMLVRPASQTPFTALAMAELAHQAGIPKGVLQVVTGSAKIIGNIFSSHPSIRKLSFTGSTEVGRELMAQSATTLKKLSLELGGNAPFIVFDDADLHKATEGLIVAKFRNAGQTCVCANRIYVQRSVKAEFLKIFQEKLLALKVGNGLNEDIQIGPLVNQSALQKVKNLLKDALDKGATLHCGGDNIDDSLCFQPTLISDVNHKMAMHEEEIFGPIAAVYDFDTEQQAIAMANDSIYGLAAYFYTQDLGRSWRVAESLEYGMVGQNTGLVSNAVAPFGGIKQSGFGREGSKYGIEEYIVTKYWCINVATEH
ncbi:MULTISPECIES: NAD-dependent succinate-semialdehyde dehydrogenase [unclassified Acinetobacter]|uniref:NAD-dependent succinate-semialdehyde dehydrogenase n=1 Tax=unclassified Acinetobacter TaxID=196816 RepID=UPI0035B6BAE8